MKLILHIVRKDFLRLRWWLGLWGLVLAAKFGLGFYLALGAHFPAIEDVSLRAFGNWSPFAMILAAVDAIMTCLIAALLVQEDGLVESNAFWLTRPVSGRRLLAAKVTGAGVMLGLPLLVLGLPWWLTCGFGGGQIVVAATEALAVQTVIVMVGMTAGALTDVMSRVVIWPPVMAIGIALALATASSAGSKWLSVPRGVMATRGIVEIGVFMMTLMAVIAAQFLGRRVWRSHAAFGFGLFAAVTVAALWPWDWVGDWSDRGEWAPQNETRAAGVKLTLAGSAVTTDRRPDDDRGDTLLMRIAAQGVPTELKVDSTEAAYLGDAAFTWRWPGGSKISGTGYVYGFWPEKSPAVRLALGLDPLKPQGEASRGNSLQKRADNVTRLESMPIQDFRITTHARHSVVARLRTAPAVLAMQVKLRLMRPELGLELPLRPGGWQARGGVGKRIVSQAVRGPRAMTWACVESEPAVFTDWYRLAVLGFPPLNVWGDTLVVHRDRGDLGRVSGRATATVYVAGVILQARLGQVNVPQDIRNDEGSSAVAKWWEGMSLAVVRYREEARFTREVTADPFVLDARRKP